MPSRATRESAWVGEGASTAQRLAFLRCDADGTTFCHVGITVPLRLTYNDRAVLMQKPMQKSTRLPACKGGVPLPHSSANQTLIAGKMAAWYPRMSVPHYRSATRHFGPHIILGSQPKFQIFNGPLSLMGPPPSRRLCPTEFLTCFPPQPVHHYPAPPLQTGLPFLRWCLI